MGNLPLVYLPPNNWQDFEKLLRGVIEVIWEQKGWQNYGRLGQSQLGIDLFGYDNRGIFVGVQCKKINPFTATGELLNTSILTESYINKEICLAEQFRDPSIEKFIFATTSSRDTKAQDVIKKINGERKKKNEFLIELWFWEDLQVHIENHQELMYWYYSEMLEKIHKYDKNIHIITMLRQAFTRPAFNRVIWREESGADFIQAIKNTQEAISSGKLYNRRGDLLATSFSFIRVSKETWKEEIKKIYDNLEKIRNLYQDGVQNRQIKEHPTCIEVFDFSISEQLNSLRKDCLIRMNRILADVGLNGISSELLK